MKQKLMMKFLLRMQFGLALAFMVARPLYAEGVTVGQNEDQVVKAYGEPKTRASCGEKAICTWPTLKVTFVNGVVASFQVLDPEAKRLAEEERRQKLKATEGLREDARRTKALADAAELERIREAELLDAQRKEIENERLRRIAIDQQFHTSHSQSHGGG